jgi:hypothetical protein
MQVSARRWNASGLYTAPAISRNQTVVGTGKSDPGQSASASVTLTQVLAVDLTSSAPSLYMMGTGEASTDSLGMISWT